MELENGVWRRKGSDFVPYEVGDKMQVSRIDSIMVVSCFM